MPGGSRPGCVTIMTIHRSKGLQFPVVFVADTARRFNAADTRQPVLLHRVYGAGLRLRPEDGEGSYKTAAYAALANVHAAELRSEQMRLLYVALTRAQDKLILTIPLGMTKTTNPLAKAAAFLAAGAGETLNRQANSFADWLRTALLVHPNGGPLRRLAENLELPFADTRSTIAISFEEAPEELQPAAEEAPAPEAPAADPVLTEQLRQGFAWQYPAASLAAVPAKVSVTSIVHKREQTALERPGFLSKDGLTAAEMGTALHAFLEHADFAALAAAKASGTLDEAICAERDRQVAVQLTPPEIAEKLDVRRIRRFCRERCLCPHLCGGCRAAGAGLHHGPARLGGAGCTGQRGPGGRSGEGQRPRGRALRTSCSSSRTISNCWTIRPTAARPRPTSSPPTAPSSTCTPSPSTSALRLKKVTYKGIYSLDWETLIE